MIKAWAEGEVVQGFYPNWGWVDIETPQWDSEIIEYRIKPKEKGLYSIGQKFKIKGNSSIYTLVTTGENQVMLIDLRTGNRWSDTIYIGCPIGAIPEEIMFLVTDGHGFTLIK